MSHRGEFEILAEKLGQRGIDVATTLDMLARQEIANASWALGNGGTRYAVYPWRGAARNIYEKFDDAGYLNKLTGLSPTIALILPWDVPQDWSELRQYGAERGIRINSISPTFFESATYKLGSMTNANESIRARALDHLLEVTEMMPQAGAEFLTLWFHDGTNYPGQDSMRRRKRAMEDGLAQAYKRLPANGRMLIEYKFYEPAFYHTDFSDWGSTFAACMKLGERAKVLVDTGHHPLATNVAHIVSMLLDEGRLGGFHLNSRRYGDDDAIVGSGNGQELFEIYNELVSAGEAARDVAYMFDQSHNIESKLEAHLLSAVNAQRAYARALIVNPTRLAELQADGNVLGAHRLVMAAYNTDVEPLLVEMRQRKGLPDDPLVAFEQDDYAATIERERGAMAAAASSMGSAG